MSLHLVPPTPREPARGIDLGTIPLDGLLRGYAHALRTLEGHAAELLSLAVLEIAEAIHLRARSVALEAVRARLVPTLPPTARAAWFAAQGTLMRPIPPHQIVDEFAARVAKAVRLDPRRRPELEALLTEGVRLQAPTIARDALDRALADSKENP
jgi:hypothetical protein